MYLTRAPDFFYHIGGSARMTVDPTGFVQRDRSHSHICLQKGIKVFRDTKVSENLPEILEESCFEAGEAPPSHPFGLNKVAPVSRTNLGDAL